MSGTIAGMFGGESMPGLTIGVLLLRLHRLHALESELSADQKAQLSAIDAQNESVHKEWTVHYNEKLLQEGYSRLVMLERFFDDCEEDPHTCANNYLPEATRRTIVEEIANALQHHYGAMDTELNSAMHKIDSKLHHYTQPSDFIWTAALQSAYPKAVYWWLYSKPLQIEAK